MKYAVIDISSTGVSMIIAEGDRQSGIFETVYKDRNNIALTDYFDGRSISARGIDKLIDALITARSTAKAMGAGECYVVSTAVLRNVDNLEEVSQKIRMRTGLIINHLDGKTEAYCDLVSNRKYGAYDKAVLVDIGGGSVELCDLKKADKSDMVCLEFGPIKLRNKYVGDIYPTEDEAKRIRKYVRKKSDEAGLAGKGKYSTVVLVGSINDAVCAATREFCEKKKLGEDFTYDKYGKFVKMLLTSSDRTRLIMKVAPEKINVLPVAAVILKELLKRFKPDSVVVSDVGVKEGYLALCLSGEEDGASIDLQEEAPSYEAVAPETPTVQKKPSAKRKKSGQKSE